MTEGNAEGYKMACGVCGRGVTCQKWVHRKCSGIKGSKYEFAEVA